MKKVLCLNCKQIIELKEITIGCQVNCECGCIQKCLDKDEYISRWRVINPFDFKDKKNKLKYNIYWRNYEHKKR